MVGPRPRRACPPSQFVAGRRPLTRLESARPVAPRQRGRSGERLNEGGRGGKDRRCNGTRRGDCGFSEKETYLKEKTLKIEIKEKKVAALLLPLERSWKLLHGVVLRIETDRHQGGDAQPARGPARRKVCPRPITLAIRLSVSFLSLVGLSFCMYMYDSRLGGAATRKRRSRCSDEQPLGQCR